MKGSALNLISSYDSDTDDSDSPPTTVNAQPSRLPLPNAVLSIFNKDEPELLDNPEEHDGRVRSFPHERGNWCSLVYIPYEVTPDFKDFTDMIMDIFYPDIDLKPVQDLHISLSRTFVLLYHWIEDFVNSVKKALEDAQSFSLTFDGFKCYTNDEKTRTFLALAICPLSQSIVKKSVSKIDECLLEYKLKPFYKDGSFHMSIAWCLGDQKEKVDDLLDQFEPQISHALKYHANALKLNVNCYYTKSGNRLYKLLLK